MSQRNRFADVALGLIIGLGIALLILAWAVPGFRDPANTEIGHQHAETSGGNEQPIQPTGFWKTYTTPSDTYAQWIAAFSALFSVGVSIWAVKLVRSTLALNRDATTAAQDAVATAREIGRAQVIAYLTCSGGKFGVEKNWFQFVPIVTNKGQSPAFDVKVVGRLVAMVPDKTDGTVPRWQRQASRTASKPSEGFCGIIPSGGEESAFIIWPHEDVGTEMHDFIVQGLSFNIDCTLHWRDVFGGINVVNFSLREGDARELAPLLEKELLRSGRLVAFNHGQSRPEQ